MSATPVYFITVSSRVSICIFSKETDLNPTMKSSLFSMSKKYLVPRVRGKTRIITGIRTRELEDLE